MNLLNIFKKKSLLLRFKSTCMNKHPDIILDQFVDKGRMITYLTKWFNEYDDGRMHSSVAVFKVTFKHRPSWWKRKRFIKYWSNHFIANQVHAK